MGYTVQRVCQILNELEERDLLIRSRTPGRSTEYNFRPFSLKVLEVATTKANLSSGSQANLRPALKSTLDEEEKRKKQEQTTNGANDAPANLKGWLEAVRESNNRPATLRWMISVLYPYYKENDLPSYGYIGKIANDVQGAGMLTKLIWRAAEYEPQGNLMSYIKKMHNGGTNGRDRSRSAGAGGRAQAPHRYTTGWEGITPEDAARYNEMRRKAHERAVRERKERDAAARAG